MRAEQRALVLWWSVAALLLVAGRVVAGGLLTGVALGLAIGATYVWLLMRRVRASAGMPLPRAVAAAQVGAVARYVFVILAFAVAVREWPHADIAWGAAAFAVPLAVHMVVVARRGG